MKLSLRAQMVDLAADNDSSKHWQVRWLEILGRPPEQIQFKSDRCDPRFRSMCNALMDDVHPGEDDLGGMKTNIELIESGEEPYIVTGGNAWIIHLTPEVIWFEGQYDQTDGEADPVTFDQFKFALQTYTRFLGDPERKPIEVPFPDDPTPEIPDVSEIRERLKREGIEERRIYALNTRDREVLGAIRAGMSDTEICATLKLAPERLAQYRLVALEKTGLASLEQVFDMIDRVDLRLAERAKKEARWR